MGSAEGGMTGQIIGEQIDGTSKILEKMALASPSIHTHWHPCFCIALTGVIFLFWCICYLK